MPKKKDEVQLMVSIESGLIKLKDSDEYAVTIVLGSFPTQELARGVHDKAMELLQAIKS